MPPRSAPELWQLLRAQAEAGRRDAPALAAGLPRALLQPGDLPAALVRRCAEARAEAPGQAAALAERFLPGTAPTRPCTVHGEGGGLVLGADHAAWARAEGLGEGGARGPATALGLPGDGDVYSLEPGLPAGAQAIPVRAVARFGVEALEFRLDGGERVPLPAPFVGRVPAVPGEHRLELYERGGERPAATARFRVWGG